MLTKVEILEKLKEDVPDGSGWAYFPMQLNAEETLAIWIVPEKMKLLRMLGIIHALSSKNCETDMIRTSLKGLVVERVKTESIIDYIYAFGGCVLKNPELVRTQENNPYAVIGLRSCCFIHASKNIKCAINLQHFIDDIDGIFTHIEEHVVSSLSQLYKRFLKKDGCIANYLIGDGSDFFLNYRAIIPSFKGYEWIISTGASKQIRNFLEYNFPGYGAKGEFDQCVFKIIVEFWRVIDKKINIFIEIKISANEKYLSLYRSLIYYRSPKQLLQKVEDILKIIFPKHK